MKLYNHLLLDPDIGPQELLSKVQFDIRFYFCRRGAENLQMVYVKKVQQEPQEPQD